MIEKDDWRLKGQEKFLTKKELFFVPEYTPYSKTWEHEHCIFCTAKISDFEGSLHEGYCTTDKRSRTGYVKNVLRILRTYSDGLLLITSKTYNSRSPG